MKTVTITWIYYENFGTYLQAYALQNTIMKLGHDNIIIDDSCFYQPSILGKIRKTILNIIQGKNNKTHKYYSTFKSKYLKIGYSSGRTECFSNKYDVYLCGSDQIWSPYLDFNPYYYLAFTDKKKVAYAPSIGTGVCSNEYKANVKPFIEKFAHVAVREEDGAKMLSTFIDKEIKVVLDPTLLLTREEWSKLESEVETDIPYILCYILTPNKWYLDCIKEYAQRHNQKVKIFNTNPLYKELGFEVIDAGPGEFISYIKKAEKIFTDSFHSTIFSILYHKDFVTFKRFKDGGEKDQNTRIADLFKKLGIDRNFIGEERISEIENLEKLDYDKIDVCLDKLRIQSKDYLLNAIEN